MTRLFVTVTAAALELMAAPASAQFIPSQESLSDVYTGKAYSPYAQRTFLDISDGTKI